MSLSKPKSPLFVGGSEQPVSESVGLLDTNQNATLINQLHGIANTNATGAGIPKQVSNVQASVANAQTGSTCTVTVLYRQDPTDKNFAGVNVWVKGYQGNNQLVQVASGVSSPTKFVLNNTGEIVSFTVQAYGNGGGAPLTGSPTCSGTLPKATSGGFSSSSNVAPSLKLQTNFANNASQSLLNIEAPDSSIFITNPSGGNVAIQGPQFGLSTPGWITSGDGSNYSFTSQSPGLFGTGTANQVKFWMVRLYVSAKITTMTFRFIGAGSGGVGGWAIYDSTGQTKLLSFDNFAFSGGSGPKVITNTSGTVILPPGIYMMACAQSVGPTAAATQGGFQTEGTSDNTNSYNANVVIRSGVGSNPMVSGVCPASLGTLSLTTALQTTLPHCTFEP